MGSTSQNSLAVVMRRMREAVHANGISEPTLEKTEVEYQHALALKCAAGLQFPSLTIVVASPVISMQ